MRNLHSHITREYDGESKELFCHLERIQLKMADFQNHRHFTLRCPGKEVVPVSIKLKSQVKTPKGLQIIRKAEIALINERVRSINNTINMLSLEADTCIRRLKEKIKEEDFLKCINFIDKSKEARHLKTMTRQKEKLKTNYPKTIYSSFETHCMGTKRIRNIGESWSNSEKCLTLG